MAEKNDVRYLTPIDIETKKVKYCRFRKNRIKFIDYKDPDYLMYLVKSRARSFHADLQGHPLSTSVKLDKPSSVRVT